MCNTILRSETPVVGFHFSVLSAKLTDFERSSVFAPDRVTGPDLFLSWNNKIYQIKYMKWYMGFETLVIRQWEGSELQEITTRWTLQLIPGRGPRLSPRWNFYSLSWGGGAESVGSQGGQSSQDWAPEPRELHREGSLETCGKAPHMFIKVNESTLGGWRVAGGVQRWGREWRAVPRSHGSLGILLVPSNQIGKLIIHEYWAEQSGRSGLSNGQ